MPPFDPLHGSVRDAVAPNHRYAVVSCAQIAQWWPRRPPDEVSVVHNGIDIRNWPISMQAGDYALWCGRITPNKGPHFAIAACRRLGLKLHLFGHLEDQPYFEAEIAPFLDDRITYGGNLDTQHLRAEMQSASVLVFTPCWEEPFGLVMIEAMACGTPVASFDRGAVAEILDIDSGRLGTPGDVDSLAEAIAAARLLPRQGPRQRVEAAFTTDHMLDAYETLYGLALAGAARSPRPPTPTAELWQDR